MRIFLGLILFFPVFLSAKVPVVFVMPSGENGIARLEQWRPVIRYIEDLSGLNITLTIVKDHTSVREGLLKKNYDICFINSVWYVLLKKNELCLPAARAVENNRDYYTSLFIVRDDSIIRSPQDLKGRIIGLTLPYESAEGYYVPLAMMRNRVFQNIRYGRVIYSDTVESILKGIAYGTIDAGFINSNILDTPENILLKEKIRVISVSEPIPQWTIAVRKDFSEETAGKVMKTLLSMQDSEKGKETLRKAGFNQFIAAKDGDYHTFREYLDYREDDFAPPK